VRNRDAIQQGIANGVEHDVGEHQKQHDLAVEPMPDGEGIEAGQSLQERQSGEEKHLDEREVGTYETRDAADTVEQCAQIVHPGDVATLHPEPDYHCRVSGDSQPDQQWDCGLIAAALHRAAIGVAQRG